MANLMYEDFNFNVEGCKGLKESDFVACHMSIDGCMMHLDAKTKEQALRNAYALINPPKVKEAKEEKEVKDK